MSNMNVDLRDLVLVELRRINKGKLKGGLCPDRDSVTIVNYDISRLYPTDKKDGLPRYIKPPEKEYLETGLRIWGEVTGNALRQSPNGNNLIHPIIVSTTYHTNEPDSLTRLSKPSYQMITLERPDGTIISYEYSNLGYKRTLRHGSRTFQLSPQRAVEFIIDKARLYRWNHKQSLVPSQN